MPAPGDLTPLGDLSAALLPPEARAEAALMRPSARIHPRGMRRPLMGKLSTARWVWAA